MTDMYTLAHRRRQPLSLRERAVRLPYAERRVLLAELARSIKFGNDPSRGGRCRPNSADLAELLISDIRAIARLF
jgi:hypothetical protein